MTLRLGGGSSDPTDLEVKNEVARIKRSDYTSNLTGQDVIAAFERGDEVNLFFSLCSHIKLLISFFSSAHKYRETAMFRLQTRTRNRTCCCSSPL
jgi:hypothetical protein